MKKTTFLAVMCGLGALGAHASGGTYQAQDLNTFLNEFHANPTQVMEQTPYKANGKAVSIFAKKMSQQALLSGQFVEEKDNQKYLQDICRDVNGVEECLVDFNSDDISDDGRAGFLYNDLAENLVDDGVYHIHNLDDIDATIPSSLYERGDQLDVQPWSDDYWAIAKGILGYRYANDELKWSVSGWKNTQEWHMEKNPADNYVMAKRFDELSPSEKYDLLIGDENFTLTKAMWNEGAQYWTPEKEVETWMGICHGWAAAAYMLDRPTKPVTVTAVDGETRITFYPADIKALASLLWAKKAPRAKFVGGRCNEKDPKRDENGRIQNQDCFDSNPGTWHKVVVNQIKSGSEGRSFVMDATYDYEVWNQPVYSYSYLYFNPMTGKRSVNWNEQGVKLRVSDYTNDKFSKYRDNKAYYIVGVEMTVEYMAENRPKQRSYDNESLDLKNSVTYRYDLEVTKSGDIIGGEWYTNKHPDFLWTPEMGSRAVTRIDEAIERYGMTNTYTPEEYKMAALLVKEEYNYYGPSYQGSLLATVVEELIRLANQ